MGCLSGLLCCAVLTVAWLYLGGGLAYQGCPWFYESVLAGDIVLLPLLGFNYWFMYLSILGDQSLISNGWWSLLPVYIAIFSVLVLPYCVCVCFVGLALLLHF